MAAANKGTMDSAYFVGRNEILAWISPPLEASPLPTPSHRYPHINSSSPLLSFVLRSPPRFHLFAYFPLSNAMSKGPALFFNIGKKAKGIVLKKARKIGNGKDERNFPVGCTVDTLVVFLVDLVQVVVKDFLFPAEGMSTSAASDAIASGTISVSEKASEQSVSSDSSPSGQVGDDMPKGEGTSCNRVDEASETKQIECKVHPMPPSNVYSLQLDFVDDTHTANASNEPSKPDYQPESISTNSRNYPSLDTQASAVCRHSSSVSNSRTSSCTGLSTSPNVSYSQNNSSCKPTKEFKLNPGAKVFSPMSANARLSPTSVPTNTNAGYITSYPPAIPISAVQSEVKQAAGEHTRHSYFTQKCLLLLFRPLHCTCV